MTRYELLMSNAEKCARIACSTNNSDLAIFYLNAAEGYRRKAENLTLEEAGEPA